MDARPDDDQTGWTLCKTTTADLSSIAPVCARMEAFCTSYPPAVSSSLRLGAGINLVLSELLTNIVLHAYQKSDKGRIKLRARFIGKILEIVIIDQGSRLPLQLLQKTAIEFDCNDTANLPEGGFGWNIVHSLVSDISCQRLGNSNHLKLRKTCSANNEG